MNETRARTYPILSKCVDKDSNMTKNSDREKGMKRLFFFFHIAVSGCLQSSLISEALNTGKLNVLYAKTSYNAF